MNFVQYPEAACLDPFIEQLATKVAEKFAADRTNSVTPEIHPRLLTLKQAGRYIGRTQTAMRHLVAEGRIPTVRSDRRVLVDIHDLDKWIEENKKVM